MPFCRTRTIFLLCCILLSFSAVSLSASAPGKSRGIEQIQQYISNGWNALTRSMNQCRTFADPKTHEKSALYFPADFSASASLQKTVAACGVATKKLPASAHTLGSVDVKTLHPQGLLYLPYPYVVPGGRFNEMYGWDSYFIIRGLIEDGRLELARDIVNNFFFEIEHYGAVLNANRTYYLTRSQPPFLTSMIRAVYKAEKSNGQADHTWLEKGYRLAELDHKFWTEPPHLAGGTGLSRYFDFGQGPVPELDGRTMQYYRNVIQYFLLHPAESQYCLESVPPGTPREKVEGPEFSLTMGAEKKNKKHGAVQAATLATFALSPAFYKGDRSMRESGFDVTFRFGPYGAGTPNFAAVGLNCLLYKEESDLAWMAGELGKKEEAARWLEQAQARRQKINRYLWDSEHGLYFDYDFKDKRTSYYSFATTFYPLWVGAASADQARAVEANLRAFEQPGGIVTSIDDTGGQWDYPYGWAPIQLIAIEGLRRYGYDADANRISLQFLSMVLNNFEKDNTIREKYNVVTRSSETDVTAGYRQNVIGFGWTNGVFLVLLHELPKAAAAQLARVH